MDTFQGNKHASGMKKNSVAAFAFMVAGIAFIGFFAPWWTPALWIMGIAFLFKLSAKTGSLSGGISFATVWTVMAMIMSIQDKANIISKTGILLGGISLPIMFLIIIVISFITGALSGWLGSALHIYLLPKHHERIPEGGKRS